MPKFSGGVRVDSKGYLVIKAGPQRDRRVHEVVAEAMLGRPLRDDEDVHHKDGNKLNVSPGNLQVLGHKEHGWVSAMQHQFMERKEKNENEVEQRFASMQVRPCCLEALSGRDCSCSIQGRGANESESPHEYLSNASL